MKISLPAIEQDITITLCFSYLNAEKEIPRCLKPWIPYVDYVAAVDGRYWTPLPPHLAKKYKSRYSTDKSYQVLKEVCGSDKLIHEDLYGTQMEKRQRCFDIAGELKSDIAIVFDSDDFIHPDYQDWDKFYKQLLAAFVLHEDELIFYMNAWIPSEELWPKQHNAVPSNMWRKYARIHKNPGNMRYAQSHYTWAKKDVTDDMINKWKWEHLNNETDMENPNNPYLLQHHILIDGVRVGTDRTLRDTAALEFGDGWAFQNMHWENYHYNIKPYVKYKGLHVMEEHPKLKGMNYYFNSNGQLTFYNKHGKQIDTTQYINDTQLVQEITS